MKLYLADKMQGIPYFNAPWFDKAAKAILAQPGVTEVFNPADHDREQGFDPMLCPNGTAEEAEAAGFVRRHALRDDWAWIAENSDGLIIGPLWRTSLGAISEIACHQALGLPVFGYPSFIRGRRVRIPPLLSHML